VSVAFELLLPFANVDISVRRVAKAWTSHALQLAAGVLDVDVDVDALAHHCQPVRPLDAPVGGLSLVTRQDGRGVDLLDGRGAHDRDVLERRVDAIWAMLPESFSADLPVVEGHLLIDALDDISSQVVAWSLALTLVHVTRGIAVSTSGDAIWIDAEDDALVMNGPTVANAEREGSEP